MPAFSPLIQQQMVNGLAGRDLLTSSSNITTQGLQLVCAWPVSGQYGPGSRILYYTLVAACVLARKAAWLRDACLAAALVFPAVAALHGIVLACLHQDGAVDMDVYGAFQLSAIAVLAAPVTVRVSDTYFFGPGRNIIFVWTGIILAGMLSLTVEFYRSNAIHCDESNWGNFTTYNPEDFPYSVGNLCGITCSEEHGPFSPMRKDATAEIYIIPAPVKFNFGTATLTAAACCIPAILSLASLMNKIREFNWRRSRMGGWRDAKQDPGFDEPIDGFHGATFRTMNSVNNNVRHLLRFIEIPLFAAAVAAILIIGELNLWDPHIVHGTEPIASVGQWAPIVTAGLAALGSLYLLIEKDATAAEMEEEARQTGNSPGTGCCSCTQHHGQWSSPIDSHNHHPWSAGPTEPLRTFDTAGEGSNNSCSPILTRQNSRMKIAKYINKIGKAISTPASDLDDASFRAGPAGDFPEAPGERLRDPRIQEIQKVYNIWRDANGNVIPSRTHSVAGSRAASPQPSAFSRTRSASPGPLPRIPPRSSTLQDRRSNASDMPQLSLTISAPAPAMARGRAPVRRRATLEVPAQNFTSSDGLQVSSPAIVISASSDGESATTTPRTLYREPLQIPTASTPSPT
ncbi:hypothetical protein MCOR27_000929 [Pyricularia oryzae]|uniref:Uncharacterized protein n=1 Tax=Pyricularia grisea TaxID=148305 RepID=A0ABQ8N7P6_PYRGI|nr:hypothetical protein MCOR01_008046 [Pyricularia oryzae]KAI6292625.1 hypothetical protein MCOR33_009729 [Pyricularia grisea]KAI6261543.1 hypothetical protein MCOR19_002237 [Pyricularia oryzae]KAI6284025.1 hypothetical protein MCOR26_002152 [Pyricularia oryzae]KAI6288613.1 hypothetical protein MCOR27_000929 [Pyricularia oryzae]